CRSPARERLPGRWDAPRAIGFEGYPVPLGTRAALRFRLRRTIPSRQCRFTALPRGERSVREGAAGNCRRWQEHAEMQGTGGDAGAKAAPGTRGDAARADAKRPCSDAEEDGQRLRVVGMDDGEEDEGIEEQMHRDRIGQRLRASEDERLGKGEGDG